MKKYQGILLSFSLVATHGVTAEQQTGELEQIDPAPSVTMTYQDPRDPFEGFNRAMWDFNYLYFDKYLFRPVAHGYNDYVPLSVKSGVDNFVRNFEEPSAMVNNALQGKWGWSANAGGRFVINSTIGIVGVIDVAKMMGLSRKHDDFSEVLGYYGVPNGPYFMAPFLGPYVTREFTTDWIDSLYFPLSEFTLWQSALKWALKGLHSRASAIDQERLLDNALDPYTFAKEAYLQHVDYNVYDGNIPQIQEDDALLDAYMDELE